MKEDFWHDKWERNDIGFHETSGNSLLIEFFPRLDLSSSGRIFLPLCGKTKDIAWLLQQNISVVGCELSEDAVRQLFIEMSVAPKIREVGSLKCYSSLNIDIFVGNIFELSREELGPVAAIYDRAALVALPTDIRERYVRHLLDITQVAPQLLISFQYEQARMPGPPFSVGSHLIYEYYDADYDLQVLTVRDVVGGLKGKVPAREEAWLLIPK
ncbi:thiopurine S-methyltransferase [Microbulbifer sp. JMSA004]|uniref:thiopurine S-methyltransferase n=1 Tax=unclassified Microbulbifer TaxID=2619833 RepID=UPI0024ACC671|nr:thiopurine S-methyltransferase [Microbulbifer sp. VAAF005]WHI46239.1 thiopurine S-methyltransferase [Microbulbifer sp. VAAF005]